ncbi:hypothetical protein X777_06086 [Ooceraea biroi]|uniref:Uncharacterized protein n=1 Tax=Ooceraea biroi TaxID=2015173 RepID=A0A026WEY6_OOCBI|nr:hypothetical protein X777_06086 [Ooceraea biroi]
MNLHVNIFLILGAFCVEPEGLRGFGGFFMLSMSNSLRVHSFCNGRNRLSEACTVQHK